MRRALLLISFLLLIIACSKEPVLNIREGMTFDPDSLQIDTLGRWELYTWQNNVDWKFSLMVGTDRIKNANEITTNPYVVQGREQLKLLLRKIPSQDTIIWYETQWIVDNVSGVTQFFEMPPLLTQYDISLFCKENYIEMIFVP